MSPASITVVCYKSKTLRDGTHPLMLRISKGGKKKYISLKISVDPAHWNFKKGRPKKTCPNKDAIEKIIAAKEQEYRDLALELTAQNRPFTPRTLAKKLEYKHTETTVRDVFETVIRDLTADERIGNASLYKDTMRSMMRFTRHDLQIPFIEIDEDWLLSYERWLRPKCADTTISRHFRTLRSIFNTAIKWKIIRKDVYPFTDFNVSKFNTTTKKRALRKEDVRRIEMLDLSKAGRSMQFARDLFLFGYYAAGIDFCDMALLTYNNIKDGTLVYQRKKIQRTQRQKKSVYIPLPKQSLEILEKYAVKTHSGDDYIFPILNRAVHKTEQQRKNRMHKVIGQVNKHLKEIAAMVGIPTLTTKVARHTYATVLKRSGVDIALISETMGHTSIATTQIYLDSFEEDQIKTALQNL